MRVVRKDIVIPVDVDRTLVFWVPVGKAPPEGALYVDYYGDQVAVVPHVAHIQLLKAQLARGRHVQVWSSNGFQWAENILIALKLDHLDIDVTAKPAGYMDDVPCQEWMGQRIYLQDPASAVEDK